MWTHPGAADVEVVEEPTQEIREKQEKDRIINEKKDEDNFIFAEISAKQGKGLPQMKVPETENDEQDDQLAKAVRMLIDLFLNVNVVQLKNDGMSVLIRWVVPLHF